ncbi:hypothetical protein PENSPDRAFT_553562, partial [Peniophora sp. CONT]
RFRRHLRVTPYTFDKLLEAIEKDTIFMNAANTDQIDPKDQLAVFLRRIGHYGNAASILNVSEWSGYGHGTIPLMTKRVMEAILRTELICQSVHMPTNQERQDTRKWVASKSCPAWGMGIFLVDGTNPKLDYRP